MNGLFKIAFGVDRNDREYTIHNMQYALRQKPSSHKVHNEL